MYPQFFGFDRLPFRLRPDPDFLYAGAEYVNAKTQVLDALAGTSQVVYLVGPSGVGKTLLIEGAIRDVANRYLLCRINQPLLSPAELQQALSLQLGAPSAGAGACAAADTGSTGSPDAAPLVVVDDAQLLGSSAMRSIREVLARTPHMKILLAGKETPQRRVESLAQRITPQGEPRAVRLPPLPADDVGAYIEHRLSVAGASGKELFAPDAYTTIYQHTAGAARLINALCDAALHAACMRAAAHVGAEEILHATQDVRWSEALSRARANPPPAEDPVEAPSEEAAGVEVADTTSLPPQLLLRHGTQQLGAFGLESGRISIGRAADNALRIDALYISRYHCRIETLDKISTIVDLGSVNGVVVNGKRTKRHVLAHSDQIILGEHVLTYLAQ